MEVNINDVVVKLTVLDEYLVDLEQPFKRMRLHGLKMNPEKCAFGITAGYFLGFLVHSRGIEVNKNKDKAILK